MESMPAVRFALASLLLSVAVSAKAADWSVVFLHPNGVYASECLGGSPSQAVGRTEDEEGP